MGSRPNVDIGFGYYLGDEGQYENTEWDDEGAEFVGDFDELFNKAIGLTDPGAEYSEATKPLYHAVWDKRREAEALCPVTFIHGGSDDAECTSLVVKETCISADWDCNPCTLDKDHWSAFQRADLIETLREWAEKLGLDWAKIEAANPEGPRWIMVVSYG